MAFCLIPSPLYANPTPQKLKLSTKVSNPVEILFLVAQEEAKRGHYKNAVKLFESLLETNPTPRIQLELARVLFLDRRFHASKELFTDLYNKRDMPWSVRQNIRLYLDAIGDVLGSIRLNFSLVSDSNPRRFTDSRQVRIYGQLFTVVPPSDNKEIRGLRSSLSLAKDLSGNGVLAGYLNSAFTDFEQSQFDRWVTDIGLILSPRMFPKLRWRSGLEESYYGGDHHYEFPYLAMAFVPKPINQFRLRSEFKIGDLRVPGSSHFDATNLSVKVSTHRPLQENKSLQLELYLEKSIADEKYYSYYGGAVGAELGVRFHEFWEVQPYASVGRRVYESADLFFEQARSDVKSVLGIRVKNNSLDVAGFVPELVVQYDQNSSNLAFYSYDKMSVSLNWSSPTF